MPQNDQEIANELNTFKNTAWSLDMNKNSYVINQVSDDVLDPVSISSKYITYQKLD